MTAHLQKNKKIQRDLLQKKKDKKNREKNKKMRTMKKKY